MLAEIICAEWRKNQAWRLANNKFPLAERTACAKQTISARRQCDLTKNFDMIAEIICAEWRKNQVRRKAIKILIAPATAPIFELTAPYKVPAHALATTVRTPKCFTRRTASVRCACVLRIRPRIPLRMSVFLLIVVINALRAFLIVRL